MSNFKVGDVCVIVCPDSLNHGKECTIISGLCMGRRFRKEKYIGSMLVHDVILSSGRQFANGRQLAYTPNELRLKRPPQELGSWEEIGKLTNWYPNVVKLDLRKVTT